MGRCANMDRDLPSLLTPPRALRNCCGSQLWRFPYEATSNVALSDGNGPLQALALPAPRDFVGDIQHVVATGGIDRPCLLRYAYRAGAYAGGCNRADSTTGSA